MTIEISNAKYWKKLNYYDGILYCSLLSIDDNNDWRPMTVPEIMKYGKEDDILGMVRQHLELYREHFWIIPVRDV